MFQKEYIFVSKKKYKKLFQNSEIDDENYFLRMGNDSYHPYDASSTCDDDNKSWKTSS